MPSLLDTLDRLNYTASSIRSLASSQPDQSTPGPFTSAILNSSLGDILREADEAEYGLFTFVKDSSSSAVPTLGDVGTRMNLGRVGRKEFRGATPLRTKRTAESNKDEEPEVYLEAALKYLNHFRSIKSMPHMHARLEPLIDRLNAVRDNIERLQISIEDQSCTGHISPQSQIAEEERRISELKSRILQLRKRKEALVSKLGPNTKGNSRLAQGTSRTRPIKPKIASSSVVANTPPSTTSTPTLQPSHSKTNTKPNSRTKVRARATGPPAGKSIPHIHTPNRLKDDEEEREELFWSGGKPPKISDKSDSLLDEELDMSGVDSVMSPLHQERALFPRKVRSPAGIDDDGGDYDEDKKKDAHGADQDDVDTDDDEEDSQTEEPTIVVSKLTRESKPKPLSPAATPLPPSRPHSQASTIEPQTPSIQSKPNFVDPPSTRKKTQRTRITPEMERVSAKIWNAIPDLLLPGNNFGSDGKAPPNAKDTLAILQTIASQPIPEATSTASSPSTRSTLSSLLGTEIGSIGGTPHQIMTALVLSTLLTAPNHSIPLTVLKNILASKVTVPSPGPGAGREAKQNAAALGASATQIGTRALYGCVAKKLVKIDRGGGEQIVKFD